MRLPLNGVERAPHIIWRRRSILIPSYSSLALLAQYRRIEKHSCITVIINTTIVVVVIHFTRSEASKRGVRDTGTLRTALV
jgi:hypothetical protein